MDIRINYRRFHVSYYCIPFKWRFFSWEDGEYTHWDLWVAKIVPMPLIFQEIIRNSVYVMIISLLYCSFIFDILIVGCFIMYMIRVRLTSRPISNIAYNMENKLTLMSATVIDLWSISASVRLASLIKPDLFWALFYATMAQNSRKTYPECLFSNEFFNF